MVTREEIYGLAKDIRGYYSFGRNRVEFLQATKRGLASGVINKREYGELMGYYRGVQQTRHQQSTLDLEKAFNEGRVSGITREELEAEKEASFSGYKSPALEQQRKADQETQRQEELLNAREQARYNLRPVEDTKTAPGETIARNLALKQALPVTMRNVKLDQPVTITSTAPPVKEDKKKETAVSGAVGFAKDLFIETPKAYARGIDKALVKLQKEQLKARDLDIEKAPKWVQNYLNRYDTEELYKDPDVQTTIAVGILSAHPELTKFAIRSMPAIELFNYAQNPTPSGAGRVVASTIFSGIAEFPRVIKSKPFKNIKENIIVEDYTLTPEGPIEYKLFSKEGKLWKDYFKLQNKIFEPYGYKNFEGVYGKQRTLYGKSITDIEVKQALLELDKNKLGFGIERNPLKPYKENILSSGQTKLTQDQIVAINSMGEAFKVKVTDGSPFVYEPKLQKYIEFNPEAYKLLTVPSESFTGKIRVQQDLVAKQLSEIPKIIQKETQTALIEGPKPDVSMRALKNPPPPRAPPSPEPVKVFSKDTIVTTIDKSAFKEPISKFNYPVPEYVAETPKPPVVKADTVVKMQQRNIPAPFSLPKAQERLNINEKDNILDIIASQQKPIKTPKISPDVKSQQKQLNKLINGSKLEPVQFPKPLQDLRPRQAQIPRQSQAQITKQITDILTLQTGKFKPIEAPIPDFIEPSPVNIEYTEPKGPFEVPAGFEFFKGPKPKPMATAKGKGKPRLKRFAPTLKSLIFGEIGKTSKASITTGLGDRYIPAPFKTKKKRSKKK